jgi:hypothetical protein
VCVFEKERECVCVREIERERNIVWIMVLLENVCLCVRDGLVGGRLEVVASFKFKQISLCWVR